MEKPEYSKGKGSYIVQPPDSFHMEFGEKFVGPQEAEFPQTLGHDVPRSLFGTLAVAVQLVPDGGDVRGQHLDHGTWVRRHVKRQDVSYNMTCPIT